MALTQNPPTFLGQTLPASRSELAARIIGHCQSKIGGAGVNLENIYLYNLTDEAFGTVWETLADLYQDPYIVALRQALGDNVVSYFEVTDNIDVGVGWKM